MPQVTAPPELLYNLRLWLHQHIHYPGDKIPDDRLAGVIAGLEFEWSLDGSYAPLTDVMHTVTLADGTTVEFLRGREPEWTVRNWQTPNLFDLHRMLDETFVPKPAEETLQLRLPPGTTIDNLRIAPGIDWYTTNAGASPYVALDGSPVPGNAVPPSEGYGAPLTPGDNVLHGGRGVVGEYVGPTPNGLMVFSFPPEAQPCPDCRGTGEYQGLASVEPCRTCGGSGHA